MSKYLETNQLEHLMMLHSELEQRVAKLEMELAELTAPVEVEAEPRIVTFTYDVERSE